MTKSQTMRCIRDFLSNDSGATAIEYAMIASGVAGAIVAIVMATGTTLNGMYTNVSTSLK